MKFLILLAYFNRPNLVKFALSSVLTQSHEDFELVICDDGSDIHIDDVLKTLNISDSRIKTKRLNDSIEQKSVVGSRSGLMLNEAMSESDADIVIILCDDDALYPKALESLNQFYSGNQEIIYSYGKVSIYNPAIAEVPKSNLDTPLNRHKGSIMPVCHVDASQVSWRLREENSGVFPYPQNASLDAAAFQHLYNLYGLCPPNEVVVQYKGEFEDQLGNRMRNGVGLNPTIQ